MKLFLKPLIILQVIPFPYKIPSNTIVLWRELLQDAVDNKKLW